MYPYCVSSELALCFTVALIIRRLNEIDCFINVFPPFFYCSACISLFAMLSILQDCRGDMFCHARGSSVFRRATRCEKSAPTASRQIAAALAE